MESGLVKPKGVGDIRYHMCPKDFTIDCIINPAFACPPLYPRNGSLASWNSSSLLRCKRSNLDHFQVDLDAS